MMQFYVSSHNTCVHNIFYQQHLQALECNIGTVKTYTNHYKCKNQTLISSIGYNHITLIRSSSEVCKITNKPPGRERSVLPTAVKNI